MTSRKPERHHRGGEGSLTVRISRSTSVSALPLGSQSVPILPLLISSCSSSCLLAAGTFSCRTIVGGAALKRSSRGIIGINPSSTRSCLRVGAASGGFAGVLSAGLVEISIRRCSSISLDQYPHPGHLRRHGFDLGVGWARLRSGDHSYMDNYQPWGFRSTTCTCTSELCDHHDDLPTSRSDALSSQKTRDQGFEKPAKVTR